jgi:hypothetical protein
MSGAHRAVLGLTMTVALAFGSLHLLVPGYHHDFDRIHVFLFNLVAGGLVLLYQGQGRRVTPGLLVYFALAMAYAVSAYLELYLLPILLSLPMLLLTERIRVRRFGSFFPHRLFRTGPTGEKFLEAALLCLSIGTGIASLVMLNAEHLHLLDLRKLTLDLFFLGYSFPLSLLTMSVMFGFADQGGSRAYTVLKELGFWSITLGVIVFFVFILFEVAVAELVIAILLLAAVCMVFWLFATRSGSAPRQQRAILLSGMGFLFLTGVTGVLYLLEQAWPPIEAYHDHFLVWHATIALYGWNLSGLFIVVRWEGLPIARSSAVIVGLHWLTVMVLAPLGKYSLVVAAVAVPVYALLVGLVFFGRGPSRKEGIAP